MGVLFEFLFEVIFELAAYTYLKLMTLIVPDKVITKRTERRIKKAVAAFSVLLGFILFIGIVLITQSDPVIKKTGKYMAVISLSVIVIQMVSGIILKIVNKYRHKP